MDSFTGADSSHIRLEKQKARELRKSTWWDQKLQQGICYYCEQMFPKDQLTMDHKVPLVRGGKSTKGNLVVSCKECNSQKGHRLWCADGFW